jgi:hypothetical protein
MIQSRWGEWGHLSGGIAAIIGAVIGTIATAGGVIVQAVLKNRADAQQRREAREGEHERQRRELVQRYLFQLQDAVVSLRLRLVNWAHRGGQAWSESIDPGYWDVTTLYALGRALSGPNPSAPRRRLSGDVELLGQIRVIAPDEPCEQQPYVVVADV